jgi:hypothetical protein
MKYWFKSSSTEFEKAGKAKGGVDRIMANTPVCKTCNGSSNLPLDCGQNVLMADVNVTKIDANQNTKHVSLKKGDTYLQSGYR